VEHEHWPITVTYMR